MEGIIFLAIVVLLIASLWKVFVKAGQPGWACLIPFYNMWKMAEIAGKPGWWMFLTMIPFIGFIFAIIIANGISRLFGHGIGMTLLLIFVPFVGYPILGFGSSVYDSSKE